MGLSRVLSVLLYFTVAPQLTHFDFGVESVNTGDSVSLICNAHKGDLPIKLSWLLNNNSINGIPGITTMRNGRKVITLTIDPVQSIHYGEYACLAENAAGKASYSAMLHVNGNHKTKNMTSTFSQIYFYPKTFIII